MPGAATAHRPAGPDPSTRDALVTAALEVLAAGGAAALNIRAVARAAGCSTMGLYTHFGSKDGLLDELYRIGFTRLRAAFGAVTPTADPIADLLALGLAYRRFALADAALYSLMFERSVPGYQPHPDARAEASLAFDVLTNAVARCHRASALVAPDAAATAYAIFGATHGLVSLELTHLAWAGPVLDAAVGGTGDPEVTFLGYVEAITRGLGNPPH